MALVFLDRSTGIDEPALCFAIVFECMRLSQHFCATCCLSQHAAGIYAFCHSMWASDRGRYGFLPHDFEPKLMGFDKD